MDDQIKRTMDEAFSERRSLTRNMLERIWFRNILYYIGEQYIEWVVSLNSFRRKPSHPFVPTPVANIIRDYVKAMKALILNKDYTPRVWPNSNDFEDKEASMLGERLLNWMDSDNDGEFLDEVDRLTTWFILLGVGFNRTYPDMSTGRGKEIKSGEVISVNVLPFNMVLDDYGDRLRKKRFVGMKYLQSRTFVEETYNVKLKETKDDPNIINYERRLMKLVGNVSPWKSSGLETSLMDFKDEDLVIVKEMEFKPNKAHENGYYVIQTGEQVLYEKDQLPIPTEDGIWNYSFTDFHFDYVPGRYWSDSGINDLISPQNSINRIDQALEMNRLGLGRPMVLSPIDLDITRDNKYGQSLLILKYDALLSGGNKPEFNRGIPLPQEVLLERNIHMQTAQDSGGDPKQVLRGKPSSARSSGIQVDILRDTAEQNHAPMVRGFYRSLKGVYRKKLILAKTVMTEERMIKIAGKENDVRVIHFKGSQLRDNTDVRLELSQNIASTQAGRTQALTQMVQVGFFGDLNEDPELRYELMKRVGLGTIKSKSSIHVMRAERENSKILSGDVAGIFTIDPESPAEDPVVLSDDPYFKFDDHFTHYETHVKMVLSAEFESLEDETKQIAILHTDAHQLLMRAAAAEMAKQQALMAQGGKNPPPGQPGTDAGGMSQTTI